MSAEFRIARFALAVAAFSILGKVMYILTMPGRFVAGRVGGGSATLWTLALVAFFTIVSNTGQFVTHAGRNTYLHYFSDRAAVPLNFSDTIKDKITFSYNAAYPNPTADVNGVMYFTFTNNSDYPITKLFFVCEVFGDDQYSSFIFNSDYVVKGIMYPGETQQASVPFRGPAFGSYLSKCKYGGAESVYKWWEGVPKIEMQKHQGIGADSITSYTKQAGADVHERKRIFLDANLNVTNEPSDGIVDKTPVWEHDAPQQPIMHTPSKRVVQPPHAYKINARIYAHEDGSTMRATLYNDTSEDLGLTPLRCEFETEHGPDKRWWLAFRDGVKAGQSAVDEMKWRDITDATGEIRCVVDRG